MGTGIHGGFGKTYGAKVVAASPIYVGKGLGEDLAFAAKSIQPERGYIDVVIHGTADHVCIMKEGQWENLDQRRLATMLKHDVEYHGKSNIRLIACNTGAKNNGFAQNLANKLGVRVKAPSDTLWILRGGKMSIGKVPYRNTGDWIVYSPYKKGTK